MIVLFDIDHVVADAKWRDWMIRDDNDDDAWASYHLASSADRPAEEIVSLVRALACSGAHIIGVTARPERFRQVTLAWFVEHDVIFHELLMRENQSYEKSPALKLKLIQNRFPNGFDEIAFAVDDRDDVIAMYRANDITCLQCFLKG